MASSVNYLKDFLLAKFSMLFEMRYLLPLISSVVVRVCITYNWYMFNAISPLLGRHYQSMLKKFPLHRNRAKTEKGSIQPRDY